MNEELAYKIWRAVITLFVAGGMALAIENNQPWLGIIVLGTGFTMLSMLRNKYKSVVLVDERIKRITEKAASTTLWFFFVATATTAIIELTLETLGYEIIQLKVIMEPLSIITLGVIVVYTILVRYYSKKM